MVEFIAPGVFVEETGTTPMPIEGVPTSMTAFVGRTWRGPVDIPVRITSFADYEREFGGLWRESTLGFAIKQFFENGGEDALVVRVATRTGASAAKTAAISLKNGETFRAVNPGSWSLNLKITTDHQGLDPAQDTLFNLTVTDDAEAKRDSAKCGGTGEIERYFLVSVDPTNPNFVGGVLEAQSRLVRLEAGLRAISPVDECDAIALDGAGTDGAPVGSAEVTTPDNRQHRTGLYALSSFSLLCIPPYVPDADNDIANDWIPAAEYCRERGAMLIVDPPARWTPDTALAGLADFGAAARDHAAIYFPWIVAANPLEGGKHTAFAPCGAVAGVVGRTDVERGIWAAPAGLNAPLRGIWDLAIKLSDVQIGVLTAGGMNCLRALPTGWYVWGARTLAGADTEASRWKYIPVRRLISYIVRSIDQGTQWAVFEPNSELHWARVVQSASLFLFQLWRQGALAGNKPEDAYFVRCGETTMSQDDLLNGRLIIEVGVAPLRPAEFIVLNIIQGTMADC